MLSIRSRLLYVITTCSVAFWFTTLNITTSFDLTEFASRYSFSTHLEERRGMSLNCILATAKYLWRFQYAALFSYANSVTLNHALSRSSRPTANITISVYQDT